MKEYICKEEVLKEIFEPVDGYYQRVENLLTITKDDIVKEFVEDLHQAIMRIMYCNNKEIGNYILSKDLFKEIDFLLAELEQE